VHIGVAQRKAHEHCHVVQRARARGIGSVRENTPRCDFFSLFFTIRSRKNLRVAREPDVVVSLNGKGVDRAKKI
jgi:hypothetical protein